MKILTFTRLIGLAAIGGAVYVHKQRGGTWSKASMQDTLRHLLATGADKLGGTHLQSARSSEYQASASSPPRTRISDEVKPRAYGDIGKRSDDSGRH